jgi:protein-L-isoaspartate(D-aspartate) O-methyltransferase
MVGRTARTNHRPHGGVAGALVVVSLRRRCYVGPMDSGNPRGAELAHLLAQVDDAFADTAAATGLASPGPRVRAALAGVPRHAFVPGELQEMAYEDRPLPIGEGQTISQPYIVALMSALLDLHGDERVLEIGTGCGYQTAVLARLAREVHSVEIVSSLARDAAARLAALGESNVRNVHLHEGDGHAGWPAAAPYDRIVITAAPRSVPMGLVDQLAPGGRMVLPMGPHGEQQELYVLDKREDGTLDLRPTIAVRFVPMTGFGDLT